VTSPAAILFWGCFCIIIILPWYIHTYPGKSLYLIVSFWTMFFPRSIWKHVDIHINHPIILRKKTRESVRGDSLDDNLCIIECSEVLSSPLSTLERMFFPSRKFNYKDCCCFCYAHIFYNLRVFRPTQGMKQFMNHNLHLSFCVLKKIQLN